MKKIFVAAAILCGFVTPLHAQESGRLFQKFKGELSFGYARFSNDAEIKNGFVIALEPKFMILDQLAISARLENTILGKNFETIGGENEDFKVKAYQSALFATEFYFTKDYKLRPFAGGGAGVYNVVASGTNYYTDSDGYGEDRQAKFGGMFRAGVEIKHFRIGLEYNLVPETKNSYYTPDEVVTRTNKNSYFSIKLGYCFGGALLKE